MPTPNTPKPIPTSGHVEGLSRRDAEIYLVTLIRTWMDT
jgi:hypothetical protein